jgi:hypothetical protein
LARGLHSLFRRQSPRSPERPRVDRAPRGAPAHRLRGGRRQVPEARPAAVAARRSPALRLLRRAEQDARPGAGIPIRRGGRRHRAQSRSSAAGNLQDLRSRADRLGIAVMRLSSRLEIRTAGRREGAAAGYRVDHCGRSAGAGLAADLWRSGSRSCGPALPRASARICAGY